MMIAHYCRISLTSVDVRAHVEFGQIIVIVPFTLQCEHILHLATFTSLHFTVIGYYFLEQNVDEDGNFHDQLSRL